MTVTVTYTGTVSSIATYATDTAGLFGPKGGDLSGKAFTANLSYDVKFDGTYNQVSDFFEQSLEGGPEATNGPPSPSLGAWITINGHVQSTTGNLYGYIDEYSASGTAGMSDDAFSANNDLRFSSAINGPFGSLPIPPGIETPFSYTFTSFDRVSGFFDGAGEGNSIVLAPASVTEVFGVVPAPAPTPLPAALPLFASGVAGAGLLCWRRKRRSAPKA